MSETVHEDVPITEKGTAINTEDERSVPLDPTDKPCTPPPEESVKTSKKRLREVSLEAQTPKDEDHPQLAVIKEPSVPPKRNRLRSGEPTVTEETQSLPTTPPSTGSPPLSTSPPYDSKVQQIRKRVKDLNWQEAQRRKSDEAISGEVDQQDDGPEAVVGDADSDGKPEDEESCKSVGANSDSEKDEVGGGGEEEQISSAGPPASYSPKGQPVETPHTPVTEPEADAHGPVLPDDDGSAAQSTSRLSPDTDTCQGKRRRDDDDQNPREAKRITPPPEQEKDESKSTKQMGFMAYASSTSPFATAKNSTSIFGQATTNLVFGNNTILKPPAVSPFASTPVTVNAQTSHKQTQSNLSSTSVKFGSTAFDAYASTTSPFATSSASTSKSPSRVARSKSPGRHANAFGPYSARSGKFTAAPVRPVKKLKRGDSVTGPDTGDVGTGSGSTSGSGDEAGEEEPGSPTNFGDILRAKENKSDVDDEEEKIEYREQEVLTGEEDERTEYQVRAKLFAMEPPHQAGWKERGVGTLRLNVNKKTGRDARLVLRTDGVLRLILNTTLFKGMNFEAAQDPRYVKFGIIEDKKVVLYTLRLASIKHAEGLLQQVKAHTPGASYNGGDV